MPRRNKQTVGRTARRFLGTLNNPTPLEIHGFVDLERCIDEPAKHCRFLCFQEEQGEGTATRHLQFYLELRSPSRITGVQAIQVEHPGNDASRGLPYFSTPFRRAHFEIARGTPLECITYCSKPSTRVDGGAHGRFGTVGGQGKRSDIESALSALRDGGLDEVMENHGTVAVMYPSGMREMDSFYRRNETKIFRKVSVLLIYGPSGTGKSRMARSLLPNAWWYSAPQNGCSYALGYSSQTDVIIDDFISWIPPAVLWRLLDGYPYNVNTKAGSAEWKAQRIIITSNFPLDQWFPKERKSGTLHHAALERRIPFVQFLSSAQISMIDGQVVPSWEEHMEIPTEAFKFRLRIKN